MSVSLYNLYAQACTSLAKSIIIKSEATARAINKNDRFYDQLYQLGHFNEYDPKTWRYYMHLAGQYHPLDGIENFKDPNAKIRVISLDTIEEIDFTIENLKEHRATWREYQKGSTYYQKLVEKYPTSVKLIDGILNPIDINKAIKAKDNEILQWDTKYVEGNELTLMANLQKRVDLYFERYDNHDYEKTDSLYVAAKIGIFYTYLPYIIMQLRYEAARTIEAHSFHVWSYLGSHQRLDEYRDHLNLYQRMWFYRNIRWVEANPGKESTFEKLIDVIMTNRQLPIAEFNTRQITTEMEENTDTFYPDVNFKRIPLNLKDVVTKAGNTRTIEETLEKEVPEARDNIHFLQGDQTNTRQLLTRSSDKLLSSKVLESFATDSTKRQAIRLGDIQLNEWIYMTTQGLYNAKISVVNPKTSDVFNFSQDEALIVFIYSLIRSYGFNPTWVPTITARNVLKRRRPTLEHTRTMIDERYCNPLYVYAAAEYTPRVERLISTSAFSEFCYSVWEARKIHRNLYSFTGDYREHIQIKQTIDQYYESVVCKLTEGKTSFLEYFKYKGWDIADMDSKEYAKLANEITKKALGTDLVKHHSLREVQGMMVRLLKQLSSYTVQFLKTINEEDIIVVDWAYLRYHAGVGNLGTQTSHLHQLNLTMVDFRNFKNKTFNHHKTPVLDFPIKASNQKQRLFHKTYLVDNQIDTNNIDTENLVLEIKDTGKLRFQTRMRMTSCNLNYLRSETRVPTPIDESTLSPWDLEQFRIHNTTEDRSRVLVDEDGTLITRGVVYVKKNYTGKKST